MRRATVVVVTLVMIAAAAAFSPVSGAGAAALDTPITVTLLNNLGDASTSSRIPADTREGYSIAFDQSVGLLFDVTTPVAVTEIGGFVQSLEQCCLGLAHIVAEIHPALPDGRPDRDTVIASAPLTPQTDPSVITYQHATFATLLRPGSYYALFALANPHAVPIEEGVAVSSGELEVAPGTFVPYQAPIVTGGVTHPDNYDPSVQRFRGPFQIAELVRGVEVPTSKQDCQRAHWKQLADEHGKPLHDAADCLRVLNLASS